VQQSRLPAPALVNEDLGDQRRRHEEQGQRRVAVLGGTCLTWELLSGKDLAVFHELMPPGTAEVRHFHQNARQFFFVLKGELTIEALGGEYSLHQHEGLEIPPGEIHHVRNVSASTTEFLAIAHPITFGDRVLPGVL